MAKQTTNQETKTSARETLLEGLDLEDSAPDQAVSGGEASTGEVETPAEPEAPEVETPGAEPDAAAPATQATQGFLDKVRELGYEGDNEAEAAEALVASYRRLTEERQLWTQRLQETEELARFGTEYLQKQREQQATEKSPPEQTQPEGWWAPPKFEQSWIQQYQEVTLGEDGQPVMGWKKNTPREVQESANAYQRYLEKWATDLVQRPQEVLPKIIEQEFDKLFEQRIRARDEERELATFAERVRETNRDWMYTTDSRGQEVFTQEGQLMTSLLSEAASKGMTSPQDQWEYAVYKYDYLNRAKTASVTQASEQAQQTAAQKRRQQVSQASGRPNRTGTVPRPEEESSRSQNPNLTPGQKLIQQLRQDGAEFV